MNRIISIGNVHQKENPDTSKIEYVPIFTLELANRIEEKNPDKNIDLKFGQSPADYEAMFKKDLLFGTEEEMNAARDLLMEIKRIDELDREYLVLYSGFNNTYAILINGGETQYYKFPNQQSFRYMIGVLEWIVEQERYF